MDACLRSSLFVRPEATRVLDEAVNALKEDATLKEEVDGHTCNIATAEYNLTLGEGNDHRTAWQIGGKTMRYLLFIGTLVAGLGGGIASGQTAASALGSVRLTHAAIASGKPLAAGVYEIRLTDDELRPAVGHSPNAERRIEFVKSGRVVAREVATVVSATDIDRIAKRTPPLANQSGVGVLNDGNYIRIWINRGGTNYIINMPPADTLPLPPRPPTGLSVR